MSIKSKISLLVLSLGFLLTPFAAEGKVCTFSPVSGSVTNDLISASGWDVMPSDTSDEIHILLTGDTIININATFTFDTIYIDNQGTLSVVGSSKITATELHVDTNVVYNVDNNKLEPLGAYGYGTLVYNGILPNTTDGGIGLKDTTKWHGTIWLKNYGTNSTAWSFDDYGNSTSLLKMSDIQGWLNYSNGTVTPAVELTGNGLNVNNGGGSYKTTFNKLVGSGTLTISGGSSAGNGLLIKDANGFTGTINISASNKYIVTIGGNVCTSGALGKLIIAEGANVTVASGHQFITSGGIQVNGTINVTASNSLYGGSLIGTGTVVCDGVVPSLTFGANDSWTGTVWLKNESYAGWVLSNYGTPSSTIKLTNVTGYMNSNNEVVQSTINIDGTGLIINNGNSGWKTTFNKVIGSGTLTISGGSANGNGMLIKDISQFRGSINLSNSNRYTLTLGGDTCVSGANGKLVIEDNVIATIDSGKTWNCSLLEIKGTSSITGSGTIISYGSTPPTLTEYSIGDSWSGVFWLKNTSVNNNGFGLYPDIYGNTNSVLRLTNVRGYLTVPDISQTSDTRFTTPVELYDEGGNPGFTHNNGFAGYAMCFDKLFGSGTYVTSTAGVGERVYVKDYSEFTGKLNLSVKEMIFGGERPVYDSSQAYDRNGNFNLNDPLASMILPAEWTVGGVIKTSGILSITNSVSNEINISDTGTIYVNDWRLLSSATIKGSGRLLLENYNNRDQPVPTIDGFQINISLRNESNWTGMFEFKNCYFGVILLNDWGNINSKVKFDNTTSYIYPTGTVSIPNRISEFIIENTCTFDGNYSSHQEFKIDSKITGSGNIVVDIANGATAGQKTFFLANDVSEFTGNLYFGPNSQNIRICVGPTSRAFVDKTVVIGSDRNITLSNTQNWKTGVSSYIIDGVLDTNSQSIPFYNINGSGTLKLSDPSYGNTNGFVNANWTGNVILKSHVATGGCPVSLRYMGTSNSTIELNNLTGSSHYLMPAGWKERQEPIPALVKINGEVIFNDGSSECIHEFTKLTGDGDLKFVFSNEITYEVDNLINYGGTIYCQPNNHVYLSNVYVTNAVIGTRILKSSTTDELKNIENVALYENNKQIRAKIIAESDGLYIANVAKITRDNIDYQFRSLHDAVDFSKENETIYLMCNDDEDFHLPILRRFTTNSYIYDGIVSGISLVTTQESGSTIYEATLPVGLVVEIPQFSKTAKYNPPSYLDSLPVKYWVAATSGSIENLNNWSPKHRLTLEDYGIINHGSSYTFNIAAASQSNGDTVYAYNLYVGYPVKRKYYGTPDTPFESNDGWYFSNDGVPFYGARYNINGGTLTVDNELWVGASYASGFDSILSIKGNSFVSVGCLKMSNNQSVQNSASKLTMENNGVLSLNKEISEIGIHPESRTIVSMYNNSVITSATDMVIGKGGVTEFNMYDNSQLNVISNLFLALNNSFVDLDIKNNSVINVGENMYLAANGTNLCNVAQNGGTINVGGSVAMSLYNEECVSVYSLSNCTVRAKSFISGSGSASISLYKNSQLVPTQTGTFIPDDISLIIEGDFTINVGYGITSTISTQYIEEQLTTGNKLKKTGSGTLIFENNLPNTLNIILNDGIIKIPSSSTNNIDTDIDGASIKQTHEGGYKVYTFEYTEIEL